MENQYQYAIFKYNVYDTSFLIFHTSELPNGGFSSLYYFTRETAETLNSSGIAGYKGAVWSPQLVMDFDDEREALAAKRRLKELGVKHEVWTTGNRGYHFYIDRPHSPSHLLPQIDKEWVKCNFPAADLSIYSHLHMFRLPGTKHIKTGLRKALVESVDGQPLLLADALPERDDTRLLLGPETNKSLFDNNHIMNWTVPWEEGKRHEALLHLGLSMRKLGEPMEFVARWLYHANLLNMPPKPQEELERIVRFVAEAGNENI